jgi:hypothetical protein
MYEKPRLVVASRASWKVFESEGTGRGELGEDGECYGEESGGAPAVR